jgi:Glycosyl hydrolase family 76
VTLRADRTYAALRKYFAARHGLYHVQRPDALFHDHLDLEGNVDARIWSYNQGVPVSVNALLFEITGRRRYLDEAVRIADAATAYFAEYEGDQTRLDKQPPS